MPDSRPQICQSTSAKLRAAAPTIPTLKACIGLDGFVDEIITVVDKRLDKDRYDAVPTIAAFGQKILRAVGESSNYELIVKQTKLGGNGPIMANALATAGMNVTYIGNLGFPSPHPVFNEFARRAKIITIADPGQTAALEFTDGKLMLGKHQYLREITWENILERVGLEQLIKLVAEAKLLGLVNWTMIAAMSDIWEKMAEQVLSKLPREGRKLFIDIADPEKRTADDIRAALEMMTRLQQTVDVILGLNLKESTEIAAVLGLTASTNPKSDIESTAVAIRRALELSCVVIHPRSGAAAAIAGQSAQIEGPFVQNPKISTGAGDHFNAGFCLGRVLDFSLEESLCTGVATSGFYVRTALSPTATELAKFISELPPPEN
jgi:sugar/nucleoside kinase (ribokinase family)